MDFGIGRVRGLLYGVIIIVIIMVVVFGTGVFRKVFPDIERLPDSIAWEFISIHQFDVGPAGLGSGDVQIYTNAVDFNIQRNDLYVSYTHFNEVPAGLDSTVTTEGNSGSYRSVERFGITDRGRSYLDLVDGEGRVYRLEFFRRSSGEVVGACLIAYDSSFEIYYHIRKS